MESEAVAVYDSADEWEQTHAPPPKPSPSTRKILKIVPKRGSKPSPPPNATATPSVPNLHRAMQNAKTMAPPQSSKRLPGPRSMHVTDPPRPTTPVSTAPTQSSPEVTHMARSVDWTAHIDIIGAVALVSQGILISSECADLLAFQAHQRYLEKENHTEHRFQKLRMRYQTLSHLRQQHGMFSSIQHAHASIAILLRTAGYMLLCCEFALSPTQSVLARVVQELTLLCDMTDLLLKDNLPYEQTHRPEHTAAMIHNESFVQSLLLLDLVQHANIKFRLQEVTHMYDSTIRMIGNPWLRYQFERSAFGLHVATSLYRPETTESDNPESSDNAPYQGESASRLDNVGT